MGERPVIFSGSMVRALLAGTKTQTRRLAKVKLHEGINPHFSQLRAIPEGAGWRIHGSKEASDRFTVPYAVGDRLWVREAHYLTDDGDEQFAVYACEDDDVREHLARIDGLPAYFSEEIKAAHRKLRPSIHMPRWASRLTLTVTEVRVQRLQDISEADARAEGIRQDRDGAGTFIGREGPGRMVTLWPDAREAFFDIWDSLHGQGAWRLNPWVAAISLQVTPANIDSLPEQP